jgi:hypothetical protein
MYLFKFGGVGSNSNAFFCPPHDPSSSQHFAYKYKYFGYSYKPSTDLVLSPHSSIVSEKTMAPLQVSTCSSWLLTLMKFRSGSGLSLWYGSGLYPGSQKWCGFVRIRIRLPKIIRTLICNTDFICQLCPGSIRRYRMITFKKDRFFLFYSLLRVFWNWQNKSIALIIAQPHPPPIPPLHPSRGGERMASAEWGSNRPIKKQWS